MNKKILLAILTSTASTLKAGNDSLQLFEPSLYDLTLVSQVRFRGSLGRLPIAFTDLFKDELKINHIQTPGVYSFEDVPEEIADILRNSDKTPGNVALFIDDPWTVWNVPADMVPDKSFIKIAYSLLESTGMPEKWVEILNEKFDVIIVADEYYRSVYEKSGITIPVFVLPHGIYIEEFLNEPIEKERSIPFVFGSTAAFWPRKNQELLVEAFHKEFGNDPKVKLVMHGRKSGNTEYLDRITAKVAEYQSTTIEICHKTLSDADYKKFFKSLDCYVLVSKGEGFSITPREALALGIPSIISNNTAHETICDTGFVCPVPSTILEPVFYKDLGPCGNNFNCSVEDVQKALRDVYENYEAYKKKINEGRDWLKHYLWKNLKAKFRNFFKPKKVLLGDVNQVTDTYIMTSSEELYEKYTSLVILQDKSVGGQ